MLDIVSLVQLGFAGFAAAMAVLSYRLIRLEIVKKDARISVINALQKFTKYTLYLSAIVLTSTVVTKSFDYVNRRLVSEDFDKSRRALAVGQQAQDCRESLTGLIGAEGKNRPPQAAAEVARLTYTVCFSAMQALEQLK